MSGIRTKNSKNMHLKARFQREQSRLHLELVATMSFVTGSKTGGIFSMIGSSTVWRRYSEQSMILTMSKSKNISC
jgi:hypothetical protein